MSYIEFEACTKAEYDASIEDRILEEDLRTEAERELGEPLTLYTGLFLAQAARGARQSIEAAKLTARIISKSKLNEFGLYVIRFTGVTSELATSTGTSTMQSFDGVVTDNSAQELGIFIPQHAPHAAVKGYFKAYEGAGSPRNEIPEEQEAPDEIVIVHRDRELVCA